MTIPAYAPPAFHILSKPRGAICNLDCSYCFFLTKEMLYPNSNFRMSDETLESYIKQTIEGHQTPEVMISWQGGEPTLMGLEFFRKALEYEKKYKKPGQMIQHTIQTNGTLLNDEWGQFFKENNYLVGISLDGPRHLHDVNRVDKGGASTFDRVVRGVEFLKKNGAEFNILCTVNSTNEAHGAEVYRFFRDELGAQFIQFIPIVDRLMDSSLIPTNEIQVAEGDETHHPGRLRRFYSQRGNEVSAYSVSPQGYGKFLNDVFDVWVKTDVGTVYVQMFDVTLANRVGAPPGLCVHSPTCGTALAMEHNGDLYSCDHFVEPEYLLGNIREKGMVDMIASGRQQKFGTDKLDKLPKYCRECEVRWACHGGCPKDRFTLTPDGEPGLNYLCPSFKLFFNHVTPPMNIMADLLKRDLAPADVMTLWPEKEPDKKKRKRH
jgi:uncharacterized protein